MLKGVYIKKFICSLTCLMFVISDSASAMTPAGIDLRPQSEIPSYLQIHIPDELATIEEVYEAPAKLDPRLILHIQNVHANYDAQKQVKKILDYLYKTYGFKTIFVEGAVDKLDRNYLELFPDHETNLKLVERLAKAGQLTGAEYYLMDSPEDVQAIGIEDSELYKGNYAAFKTVKTNREDADRFADKFESKLEVLSSRFFSKDTRHVLSEWKKFQKGHRDFLPFVQGLAQDANKFLNLDLNSLFAQVEWPQLTRLLVLQSMEMDLDRSHAKREQEALIQFLKNKKLSQELIEGIEKLEDKKIHMNRMSQDGKSLEYLPRTLLERLIEEAGPMGFQFHDYPNFSLYTGYLILQSELESKILFEEIEKLFEKILNELTATEREKNLLELYRDHELFIKLFHLELTRREWQRISYRRDWVEPKTMIKRLEALGNVTSSVSDRIPQVILDVFEAGFDFYEYARDRETAFYEKIEKAMEQSGIEKAVLVTGGFHTEGLMEMFRQEEVSYGILTPRLTKISKTNEYVDTLLGTTKTIFDVANMEFPNTLEPAGWGSLDGTGEYQRSEIRRVLHHYLATLVQTTKEKGGTRSEIRNRVFQIVSTLGDTPFAQSRQITTDVVQGAGVNLHVQFSGEAFEAMFGVPRPNQVTFALNRSEVRPVTERVGAVEVTTGAIPSLDPLQALIDQAEADLATVAIPDVRSEIRMGSGQRKKLLAALTNLQGTKAERDTRGYAGSYWLQGNTTYDGKQVTLGLNYHWGAGVGEQDRTTRQYSIGIDNTVRRLGALPVSTSDSDGAQGILLGVFIAPGHNNSDGLQYRFGLHTNDLDPDAVEIMQAIGDAFNVYAPDEQPWAAEAKASAIEHHLWTVTSQARDGNQKPGLAPYWDRTKPGGSRLDPARFSDLTDVAQPDSKAAKNGAELAEKITRTIGQMIPSQTPIEINGVTSARANSAVVGKYKVTLQLYWASSDGSRQNTVVDVRNVETGELVVHYSGVADKDFWYPIPNADEDNLEARVVRIYDDGSADFEVRVNTKNWSPLEAREEMGDRDFFIMAELLAGGASTFQTGLYDFAERFAEDDISRFSGEGLTRLLHVATFGQSPGMIVPYSSRSEVRKVEITDEILPQTESALQTLRLALNDIEQTYPEWLSSDPDLVHHWNSHKSDWIYLKIADVFNTLPRPGNGIQRDVYPHLLDAFDGHNYLIEGSWVEQYWNWMAHVHEVNEARKAGDEDTPLKTFEEVWRDWYSAEVAVDPRNHVNIHMVITGMNIEAGAFHNADVQLTLGELLAFVLDDNQTYEVRTQALDLLKEAYDRVSTIAGDSSAELLGLPLYARFVNGPKLVERDFIGGPTAATFHYEVVRWLAGTWRNPAALAKLKEWGDENREQPGIFTGVNFYDWTEQVIGEYRVAFKLLDFGATTSANVAVRVQTKEGAYISTYSGRAWKGSFYTLEGTDLRAGITAFQDSAGTATIEVRSEVRTEASQAHEAIEEAFFDGKLSPNYRWAYTQGSSTTTIGLEGEAGSEDLVIRVAGIDPTLSRSNIIRLSSKRALFDVKTMYDGISNYVDQTFTEDFPVNQIGFDSKGTLYFYLDERVSADKFFMARELIDFPVKLVKSDGTVVGGRDAESKATDVSIFWERGDVSSAPRDAYEAILQNARSGQSYRQALTNVDGGNAYPGIAKVTNTEINQWAVTSIRLNRGTQGAAPTNVDQLSIHRDSLVFPTSRNYLHFAADAATLGLNMQSHRLDNVSTNISEPFPILSAYVDANGDIGFVTTKEFRRQTQIRDIAESVSLFGVAIAAEGEDVRAAEVLYTRSEIRVDPSNVVAEDFGDAIQQVVDDIVANNDRSTDFTIAIWYEDEVQPVSVKIQVSGGVARAVTQAADEVIGSLGILDSSQRFAIARDGNEVDITVNRIFDRQGLQSVSVRSVDQAEYTDEGSLIAELTRLQSDGAEGLALSGVGVLAEGDTVINAPTAINDSRLKLNLIGVGNEEARIQHVADSVSFDSPVGIVLVTYPLTDQQTGLAALVGPRSEVREADAAVAGDLITTETVLNAGDIVVQIDAEDAGEMRVGRRSTPGTVYLQLLDLAGKSLTGQGTPVRRAELNERYAVVQRSEVREADVAVAGDVITGATVLNAGDIVVQIDAEDAGEMRVGRRTTAAMVYLQLLDDAGRSLTGQGTPVRREELNERYAVVQRSEVRDQLPAAVDYSQFAAYDGLELATLRVQFLSGVVPAIPGVPPAVIATAFTGFVPFSAGRNTQLSLLGQTGALSQAIASQNVSRLDELRGDLAALFGLDALPQQVGVTIDVRNTLPTTAEIEAMGGSLVLNRFQGILSIVVLEEAVSAEAIENMRSEIRKIKDTRVDDQRINGRLSVQVVQPNQIGNVYSRFVTQGVQRMAGLLTRAARKAGLDSSEIPSTFDIQNRAVLAVRNSVQSLVDVPVAFLGRHLLAIDPTSLDEGSAQAGVAGAFSFARDWVALTQELRVVVERIAPGEYRVNRSELRLLGARVANIFRAALSVQQSA